MKLRYSKEKLEELGGKINTLKGELMNLETEDAEYLIDWYLEKLQLYKTKYTGVNYRDLPDDVKQGDIVLVRLGINIGTELSDIGEDSKGHFGIIWGRQGQQFIVIPLTKKEQPSVNKYGVELGIIEGLPKIKLADGTLIDRIAYAKIDAIRSVHATRIRKILGVGKSGKVTIKDTELLKAINDKFLEYFISKIDNNNT